MTEIKKGKIFDAKCDKIAELFVVKVTKVNKTTRTFEGELSLKKKPTAASPIKKTADIRGTWNFAGKSNDVPCVIIF
ncbi:MAG: hypothetical protein PF572_05365 [Patescibacteria group bacterium]|jgi:hypothetical protein|nr:hypothetical protein [Patescibacteria group bacterium]